MKFVKSLFQKNKGLDSIDNLVEDSTSVEFTDSTDTPISVKLSAEIAPTAEDSPALEKPESVKKSLFSRKIKEKKSTKGMPTLPKIDLKGPVIPPTALWIGYLPEVTEREAKSYALGVSDKHNIAVALSYFDVFKYRSGYVYEVQEGGNQKAYSPEIIKYFESMPDGIQGDMPATVWIKTAKRIVQIEKTSEGLASLHLPESSKQEVTPWLAPTLKMIPVMPTLDNFLIASAFFFALTFLGMVTANLGRVQPYEAAPAAPVARVNYQESPAAQWRRVANVSGAEYVRALKYRAGKWELETGRLENTAIPANDLAPSSPLGGTSE